MAWWWNESRDFKRLCRQSISSVVWFPNIITPVINTIWSTSVFLSHSEPLQLPLSCCVHWPHLDCVLFDKSFISGAKLVMHHSLLWWDRRCIFPLANIPPVCADWMATEQKWSSYAGLGFLSKKWLPKKAPPGLLICPQNGRFTKQIALHVDKPSDNDNAEDALNCDGSSLEAVPGLYKPH